jgi:polysaccharide deacetylase family protein (PEP-CTERM system associated)
VNVWSERQCDKKSKPITDTRVDYSVMTEIYNILTVDVEDWFHYLDPELMKPMSSWSEYESRVLADTDRIIEVLDSLQSSCTFFVLGWVAEHHPDVVRHLLAAGHEVATHGYGHILIDQQTRESFCADLDRSIDVIEQAGQVKVEGYRAPGFVTVPWLFEELAARNLKYDASVLPGRFFNGAVADASRAPYLLPNGMWEFPYSIIKCCGAELPVFGGGYLRITPTGFLTSSIRRQNRSGTPVVVYFHPREWDPDPPETELIGVARWRREVKLSASRDKITQLLRTFKFTTIRDVLQALENDSQSSHG